MPHNLAIPIVLIVLGIFWVRFFILQSGSDYFHILPFLLLFNSVVTIYCLYYFFVYSKIILFRDKIIFPQTNYYGIPSGLIFGKKTIAVYSISKIIRFKYVSEYGKPFVTLRFLALPEAKISVISSTTGNIQISLNFYGEGQIERLIEEVLERNENIQIKQYANRPDL